jgi:Fur family ferric uptake transcriptional regulator
MRPSINETLSDSGRRITGTRRALTELIAAQEGHFTAAQLLARAAAGNVRVGRATVFRTLDMLTEMGALERLDLPDGEHAYVVCEPGGHHHHVVCRRCGRATDVPDAGLQAVVSEIGRRTGYRIDSHRLELYGLCADCARVAA